MSFCTKSVWHCGLEASHIEELKTRRTFKLPCPVQHIQVASRWPGNMSLHHTLCDTPQSVTLLQDNLPSESGSG